MILLVLLFACSAISVKLPVHWPKCLEGAEMNECLKKAIQIAVKDLAGGSKSLGVPPLDPWPYAKLEYSRKRKPVPLYAIASNSATKGFSNSTIHLVRTDWEKMEIQLSSPRIIIQGNYFINGTLLFIPLDGEGEYSAVFEGFKANVKIFFEKYRRSGQEYIIVKKATFLPDAEHAVLHMSGLFNGNKLLSERTLALINKNWKFIFTTVAPLVSETSGVPIVEVCNSIFSKVPLREFVPQGYI